MARRILILPRNLLPRGRSSFQERRPLQDQSFSSRARRPQQLTSLISAYIHGVRYAAKSSHISKITTPISVQTVTERSKNHSRNQGHNPSCYERIATCRSCGYCNPHDPHCQWRLPRYIYTGRETKIRDSPREIPPTIPHKDRPLGKKESDPKDPEDLPPQTIVHCNLRLPQSSSSAKFTVTS